MHKSFHTVFSVFIIVARQSYLVLYA